MRRLPTVLVPSTLALLACAGIPDLPFLREPEDVPGEEPDEEPPPAEAEPAPTPDAAARPLGWPLQAMATVPAGRVVPLPDGEHLLDLDLDPSGSFALYVTGQRGQTHVWRWDYTSPPTPIGHEDIRELAISGFDGSVYALTANSGGWAIKHGAVHSGPGGARFDAEATVYATPERVTALIAPYVRWDGEERVFFAREHGPEKTQILSVRRSGERSYEVTSPDGALGDLTDIAVRDASKPWMVSPKVLAAESATPLSVHPATGALLWRDGGGRTHARGWDSSEGNWGTDAVVAPAATRLWSPNGYYAVEWTPGLAGVTLVAPDQANVPVPGPVFLEMPVTASNGRTLVGLTDAGIETVAVVAPLAPVRGLEAAAIDAPVRNALAERGLALRDTSLDQLFQVYDETLYSPETNATFASVDGMLEVLHAGFQAVFVRVERDVSRPRLETFLDQLERSASAADDRRVREIASTAKRILHGDYSSPEAALAKAEVLAESELHHTTIDFADFHPRGPYATSPALQDYFRAFKYIDRLQLDEDERRHLSNDAELVAAWRAWIDTQAPYLSGTRYQGMFGDGWAASPYVRADCVPKSVQEHPLRVFPVSWGLDSEILDRTVAHDELGPGCTVPHRIAPTGLDLLTGLGSPAAAALQRADYGVWPELQAAHGDLRARFGGEVSSERFVGAWLRLVQILGTEDAVPEGVDADAWRRRLMETALASWASFRHTTVLVNEPTSAQMGDGGPDMFEDLSIEPLRGLVDPVPAAWAQLGGLLGRLGDAARATPTTDRLAEVLDGSAADVTRLGQLATRQMAGEALDEADYQFIDAFAGTVEHPYLLLCAAAAGSEADLSTPDPMMRIVDIHTWNNPDGPPAYTHVAVGRPREITVLLGDRGVLFPAEGAVYGYYEVTAPARMDDDAWRTRVDTSPRPAWVYPSL